MKAAAKSLPVPANPNKDVDLILSEIVQRFKNRESPQVTGTSEEILKLAELSRQEVEKSGEGYDFWAKNGMSFRKNGDTSVAYKHGFLKGWQANEGAQSTTIERLTKALEEIIDCTGTSTLQNKIAREALASIKK